jgi:hypothetical protein
MVSPDSKLPFKALIYRAALIWRMAELSRGALENFEKDRRALAILETRAGVETSSALWYLHAKLDEAVNADTSDTAVRTNLILELDKYLMRLAMGSRTDSDIMPQAISVLTLVDRVEKDG